MGKQRTKRTTPQKETRVIKPPDSERQSEPKLSRRKLWLFRLSALIGAPFLFALALEVGLRIAGYGYPTGFLLPASRKGEAAFVQNNRFGWRFFGREVA